MRVQSPTRRIALTLAVALMLVLLLASSAFAIGTQTRVQAIGEEVTSYFPIDVPATTSVPLTGGDSLETTANPLAALYLTGVAGGFLIEVADSDFGAFVNKIAGYGDPETFTNYWLFAVNGFMSPLGAGSVEAQEDVAICGSTCPAPLL